MLEAILMSLVGGAGAAATTYAAKVGRDVIKALTAQREEQRTQLQMLTDKVNAAVAALPKSRGKRGTQAASE